MEIRFDAEGKIKGCGIGMDGVEYNETTLPADFLDTFALGKYKARENEDGTISVIDVPGFVMPEKSVYTLDEIQKMSKEQLFELQDKLQSFIDRVDINPVNPVNPV